MHKMSIIGVSGQLGSGKDTVADYLVQEHNFVKISLADPIKRFGYHVFHFNTNQLWGASQFRNEVDARYLTGIGRENLHVDPPQMYSDYWGAAEARLRAYAKDWISSIIGNDDPVEVQSAELSLIHWFTWLKDNYDGKLSPRIVLQTLGTEWGRDTVSKDLWLGCLIRNARKVLHETGDTKILNYDPIRGVYEDSRHLKVKGVVVADVRFENEFDALKSAGGSVIRVVRPDTDAAAQLIGIKNHASEVQSFDSYDFDCIMDNNKTITHLLKTVDIFMLAFNASHKG